MMLCRHMLPSEEVQKHTEKSGTIEIAPLAYMRGRTLNHAFIILDEAQNSTTEQNVHVPDPSRHELESRDYG